MELREVVSIAIGGYLLGMLVFVIPAACVLTFACIYPLYFLSLPVHNLLAHMLCNLLNHAWASAGQFKGLKVVEYGDDIQTIADKRCLFLANHLAIFDNFCLVTAFHNKKSLPSRYMWVIYNIWKNTPMGLMWLMHGDFFVTGGAANRHKILHNFKEHLKANYWKGDFSWVVIYPEGARLYLVRNVEAKFCRKNGLAPYRHCAHPRTGAAFALLNVCGPKAEENGNEMNTQKQNGTIEYIVDCTIGYPKGTVSHMKDVFFGKWSQETVSMYYEIKPVDPQWSTDEAKLKEFLYKQYDKKDAILDEFYKTGRFPGTARSCTPSMLYGVFVYFAFTALFYLHVKLWAWPIASFFCSLLWNTLFK